MNDYAAIQTRLQMWRTFEIRLKFVYFPISKTSGNELERIAYVQHQNGLLFGMVVILSTSTDWESDLSK